MRDKVTKPRGSRLNQTIRTTVVAGFLLFGIQITGSAQTYRVTGVDFRVENDIVVVAYDLESDGRRPKWFTVRLLLDGGGQTGLLHPRTVTGDVGRVRPGSGRAIRWVVLQDYPGGLDLNEARFTVEASPVRSFLGRLPLPVKIGTTALLVGGLTLTAVLITRGSPYPEPPGRPSFY